MEIENTMTAQTSAASEGNADAGNGNAGVTEKNGSEQAVHAEFSDSDSEEQSAAEQKANARNRENARRRREGEQRRAQELQRERQEAREAAILEILDGQNPYTGEPMKDSRDIEEYLIMKEIDRQGGDPERDFAKFQKAKEREREKLATEEERTAEWYRQDRADFVAKYPDVDLDGLIEEEGFILFAEGKTGKKPLSEIYEGYCSLKSTQTKQVKEMAAHMLANRKASPGALASANGSEAEFFTAEEVRRMSPDEVHRNYEIIQRSMKKWN